jgi:bifunctional pyridoxal-dependent enzyme with beta-cystathionase and maltose regulon repressor activities
VYVWQGRDAAQAATYLAWLDCSGIFGEGIAKPGQIEQLFRSHFVGLSEGSYFGTSQVSPGTTGSESTEVIDHMRLNFGCPTWRLEEGLRRIEAAVASVPRPSDRPY